MPIVEEALLLKKKQAENKKFYGNIYVMDYKDYVCRMENGGLIKPGYVTENFPIILKKNNLRRIRVHDLRHSCGTLLLHNGASLREIQEWLGHASYQTTLRYAHLDCQSKENSANIISNIFGQKK